MKRLAFGLIATLGINASAHAADRPGDATASGPIRMLVGNPVTTSDTGYRDGDDWLALQCRDGSCALVPARLAITPASTASDGSLVLPVLRLSPDGASRGDVLAWFRRDATDAWLKPGPVSTYALQGPAFAQPEQTGTMNIAVDVPAAGRMTLVPLLDTARQTVMLQLRAPTSRQMLGELGSCLPIGSTDYMLWAGDLDGDGRADFLIAYPREHGGSHDVLYLSSLATPTQIVGPAAEFDTAEAFIGCAAWNIPGP